MSSGQKVVFSFLTAILIFAAFVLFANPGIFGIKRDGFLETIETKFYKQAKISEKQTQLDKLSENCNSYINNILSKIQTDDDAYLKDASIKAFLYMSSEEKNGAINKTNQLKDEILPDLTGLRIIDNKTGNNNSEENRHNIYYSTFDNDVIGKNGNLVTYKNYGNIVESDDEIPAKDIIENGGDRPRILIDKSHNRLVVTFPFYRTETVCDATLVCYFSFDSLVNYLMDNGSLNLGENFDPITGTDLIEEENPGTDLQNNSLSTFEGGFVTGIPHDMLGKEDALKEFYGPVAQVWENKPWKNKTDSKFERILEGNGFTWLMLTGCESRGDSPYFYVSAVYKSTAFELSKEIEILIYLAVFITLLLISFLIFSIKRDYMTKIRSRIKKIQMGIISEYLKNHDRIEWNAIALQIAARKDDLNEEIKKSIGGKSKKHEKETDALLESSWNEILQVIGAREEKTVESVNGATIDEIRRVLEEVLQSTKLNINASELSGLQKMDNAAIGDAPSELEELSDLDEIEEITEPETLDEIEEVEAAEPLDEAEADVNVEKDNRHEVSSGVSPEVMSPEVINEPLSEEKTIEALSDSGGLSLESSLTSEELSPEVNSVEELEELEENSPVEEKELYIPEKIDFENSSIISGYETFISSEESPIATVDSIFAEDLCIGNEYTYSSLNNSVGENFVFNTFVPHFGILSENTVLNVEVISEGLSPTVSSEESARDKKDEKELVPQTKLSVTVETNQSSEGLSPSVPASAIPEQKSVEDVLEELREEAAGKKEEKIEDLIEELPEYNFVQVQTPSAGITAFENDNRFYAMTEAGAFGMSQEISELEEIPDEIGELNLTATAGNEEGEILEEIEESESKGLSPEGLSPVSPASSEELSPIVENQGIFSISSDISYESDDVDQKLKNLIDSVLR